MTKYNVELREGEDGKVFETFKTLKKAVRWVKAMEDSDDYCPAPNRIILDDNGDEVEVNWDSIEYLTRPELEARYNTAESGRQANRKSIEALQAAKDAEDNRLIASGYVPLRILTSLLRDARYKRDQGPNTHFFDAPAFMPAMEATTFTLEFAGPHQIPGRPTPPFLTFMQYLTDRKMSFGK